MSLQISAIPSRPSAKAASPVAERRSASYHPSIWGDYFLRYASDSCSTNFHGVEEQIEELKEEVRKMVAAIVPTSQKLELIDQIQRLGIAYHFQGVIEEQLEQIHESYFELNDGDHDHNDLHMVALLFRLLRQRGYGISCEMFEKFKDSDGNFRESLTADILGILSLYEACHLRVHGEDVLDGALSFTVTHLESIDKNQVSPTLAKQVSQALKQPIYKGLPRLEAMQYIPIYQEEPSHNEVLLSLAKLDFNLMQEQHQKELGHIARWWKELDVARNFPFARDRVVECYFWILGVYFEPEFVLARKFMTKVIAMTSIIDDIYDPWWSIDAIDGLPKYMQVCYKALLDVYDDIEKAIAENGTSYGLYHAKEAFTEAKWFHQGHVPTMEEYMAVALVTSAYEMLATTSFVGMGDLATQDAFDWLLSGPKMVKASTTICRLMDDIVSHQFEQKRGHVASAVECFVHQHGVTEQEAKEELWRRVVEAWKDVNEECLAPTAIPARLLTLILNLTRVIDVLYTDEDNYTNAGTKLKNYVASLLIYPLPM
ncbi:hypothetical protein EUGRSUZ_F03413 [Eucalyptus grandis]|uniref:(+)-delta-cadinene synthase n=2 Tax=Eucalyptus grandis TaxID=71139 RepID=A0A059BV27_EUCGR|nr:hypothetical protein EUGRSUZ_F03413 [Eucalyptus grandis]